MSRYMWVLVLSIAVPLMLSFWPPLKFYRSLRSLIISIALVLIIFGGWDIIATYRGHWYFNPDAVWGIRVVNLPLEESLFFVAIPFCCIFTWEAINYIMRRRK